MFWEPLPDGGDLTQAALSTFRTFVGRPWERYGEQAWLGPWKEVYASRAGVIWPRGR